MTLTPSLRQSVEPFERSVLDSLSNIRSLNGFVANNVLLPKVVFRCYPDEHDALLLLPWAGYTIDAKNWQGNFEFPGNNPVEWQRLRPIEKNGATKRVMFGHAHPYHVGHQKAAALHSFCQRIKIGLERYPIYPLIVLPNGSTFTPNRQDYDPGDGTRLPIRILNMNQLEASLREDGKGAKKVYDLALLNELLRSLEAEPKIPGRGICLCGFKLENRRTDRVELGCPVEYSVYDALHDFTDTRAEVRLYRRWPMTDETDRFLAHAARRAAALFRCRVPNVIRLFNAEDMPDQLLLAFERFDGETLGDIIRARGPLPASLVRSLLTQLARTVQSLHDEGVVHHDIRPDYVRIAPNLDDHQGSEHRLVGLTNPLIDDSSLTTAVFQNNFDASFSSIEMRTHRHPARGHCQTDIFSLARLGSYCLLGESKYREVVNSQTDEPLKFELPDTDHILRGVLERSMEYRPENRFPSAREMAAELDRK